MSASCQLPYLFHQAVAVGSEQRVLLSALCGYAGGLLAINCPDRPSSSSSKAPGWFREAHPLRRCPHVVTARCIISIQELLAAHTMLGWTGIPWRIWHCGGLDWHDGGSDGYGARCGRCASHSRFGGWCAANGSCPRRDSPRAAPPRTIRGPLQGLTCRQSCCARRSFCLDHAAVALSDIAMPGDGGGLVKVRLSFTVSIPIERITLIIRTWRWQQIMRMYLSTKQWKCFHVILLLHVSWCLLMVECYLVRVWCLPSRRGCWSECCSHWSTAESPCCSSAAPYSGLWSEP